MVGGIEGPKGSENTEEAVKISTSSSNKASQTVNYSTNTKVNTMSDLKSKAPEVYQKMMEGLGLMITREMKDHQDRLKRAMREGRER